MSEITHEVLDFEEVTCATCDAILEPGTWVAVDRENGVAYCGEHDPDVVAEQSQEERAVALIQGAARDLGRLTRGQMTDLLLDQMPELPGWDEAAALVARLTCRVEVVASTVSPKHREIARTAELLVAFERSLETTRILGEPAPRLAHERTTAWVALPEDGHAVRLYRGWLQATPLWDDDAAWIAPEVSDTLYVYAAGGDLGPYQIDPAEACDVERVDRPFFEAVNYALGTGFKVEDWPQDVPHPLSPVNVSARRPRGRV